MRQITSISSIRENIPGTIMMNLKLLTVLLLINASAISCLSVALNFNPNNETNKALEDLNGNANKTNQILSKIEKSIRKIANNFGHHQNSTEEPEPQPGWVKNYTIIYNYTTFNNSKTLCEEANMTLAMLSPATETETLNRLFDRTYLWIGAQETGPTTGQFKWLNGQEVNLSDINIPWANGLPYFTSDLDCLSVWIDSNNNGNNTYKWHIERCTANNYALCEYFVEEQ